MLITPSFKKSLIVEQFQGNYLKLAKDSSKLATFNTPFGWDSCMRLPFLIASAPEVFQNVMVHLFEDIEGVEVIGEDLVVCGEDVEEHDVRLTQVFYH